MTGFRGEPHAGFSFDLRLSSCSAFPCSRTSRGTAILNVLFFNHYILVDCVAPRHPSPYVSSGPLYDIVGVLMEP
jgi:hypothetical protein